MRLRRELQTVAVPVFQFGVFSETDLTFYAGDDFDFGGRVHTNGNLFLCNFVNSLTFTDYITAVKEVVRAHFSNGLSVASNSCTGNVDDPDSDWLAGSQPEVHGTERSQRDVDARCGADGEQQLDVDRPSAPTRDIIRNYKNGAKRLDLPLVSQGATADRLDSTRPGGRGHDQLSGVRAALLFTGQSSYPAVGSGG